MEIQFENVRTGIAVSGGMDSMVLLYLYMRSSVDFCVINIEHGIRGETSLRDSEFVENFCKTHGIECHVEHIDALKYAEEQKISVELAARELRYAVFERFLKENKVKKIALAHHADDNAETVLMRIFRGTGIRGLRGITDREDYIRPLLRFTRAEIADYAEKNHVEYVFDETNADSVYTRNFIRNELLPLVKQRYPDVADSIWRLSQTAIEIDEFLEKSAIKAQKTPYGYVLRDLFNSEKIIQKYSVNKVMRELGAIKDVEFVNLNDILSLGEKDNNASVDLPFNITAVKFGFDLYLFKKIEEDFEERVFSAEETYSYGGFSYSFRPVEKIYMGLTFDGDKVEGCVVRKRADGDKFHRVNGKNKLLSDFLNEKKLLKQEKDSLLVLAKGHTVFAILGLEVAEEGKIDENTKVILYTVKEDTNDK